MIALLQLLFYFQVSHSQASSSFDPFESPKTSQTSAAASNLDFFDSLAATTAAPTQPFDFSTLNSSLPETAAQSNQSSAGSKKSAENFLGGVSGLVNLDNLVTPRPTQQQGGNPFLSSNSPYHQPAPNPMTLNQMKGVNNSVAPTVGTTMMPSQNPLVGGPGIMPPAYSQPPAMGNYGFQQPPVLAQPGFGMPMANPMMQMPPANPMMGAGMGMQPGMNGNFGGQANKNPFL